MKFQSNPSQFHSPLSSELITILNWMSLFPVYIFILLLIMYTVINICNIFYLYKELYSMYSYSLHLEAARVVWFIFFKLLLGCHLYTLHCIYPFSYLWHLNCFPFSPLPRWGYEHPCTCLLMWKSFSTTGFLNLSTSTVLDWIILCGGGISYAF